MTGKLRSILDSISGLVTFDVAESMTDADFIANIEAVNLLINLYDDLGLESKEIHLKMNDPYPELSRRIHGKRDI